MNDLKARLGTVCIGDLCVLELVWGVPRYGNSPRMSPSHHSQRNSETCEVCLACEVGSLKRTQGRQVLRSMTISFKLGQTHLNAKYTGKKIARYKGVACFSRTETRSTQTILVRLSCSIRIFVDPLRYSLIAVIDAAVEPEERGPCTRKKFAADGRSPRLFLLAEDFLLARNFLHSFAIFFSLNTLSEKAVSYICYLIRKRVERLRHTRFLPFTNHNHLIGINLAANKRHLSRCCSVKHSY